MDSMVPSCAAEAVSAEVSLFCRFRFADLGIWCVLTTHRMQGKLLPRWQLKLQSLGTKCVASPFVVLQRRCGKGYQTTDWPVSLGSKFEFESVRRS